jgi:hypothetical protein
MEVDDYEIFPLAFSQTIFEDKVNQFVINEDIDISDLVDNLGRPLSEIYISLIKTSSNNTFTKIKSGLNIPHNTNVDGKISISDIRRITNDSTSHEPLRNVISGDDSVDISDTSFYGDIVEYNELEQREKILSEVYHRFNTINRESQGNSLSNVDFNGTNLDLGIRNEGYIYKPHHKIKIREFSAYIEQGTSETLNKPDYAKSLNDGRYIWRDLLDIGFNDMNEEFLDYPFLNGNHYINSNIILPLKRQDPFNKYGLQYTNNPADLPGILMDESVIIKTQEDVC